MILFILISALLIGEDSLFAAKRNTSDIHCRNILLERGGTNPIKILIEHEEILSKTEQQALVREVWEQRHSIIAEELDENREMQYLEVSPDLYQKLERLFNSYIGAIVKEINKLGNSSTRIEPQEFITEAYFSMLRALRYYDADHKNRATFLTYYLLQLPKDLRKFLRANSSQTVLGGVDVIFRNRKASPESTEQRLQVRQNLYQTQTILNAPIEMHDGSGTVSTTQLDMMHEEDPTTALDHAIDQQERDRFQEAIKIANLTPRELQILEYRYPSDEAKVITDEEIGILVGGVSRGLVQQLAKNAINRIRAVIAAQDEDDYSETDDYAYEK